MIKIGSRLFKDAEQLEKLVIHAATRYEVDGYVEDFEGVEITDPEYDELIKVLKTYKPDSRAFKGTSPSEAENTGGVVIHNPPMTSISKADGDEKKQIWESFIEPNIEYCQTYKHDGVALRCNYVDGKIVSAGLRPRDGINGTDVTQHMINIMGVPQELKLPLTLSLNGEIECWDEDFDKINKQCDENGEDKYKNPRNYTAGCLGRKHASETKNSGLRVAWYSITGFDEWDDYYTTEIERAKWANSKNGLGLQNEKGKGYFVRVLPHTKYEQLEMMEKHAKNLPYYTDGVVIKINDLAVQEEKGHIGDNPVNAPRGALAWKYEEETTEAIVSSIEWNASRTGRVVPTAIFDKPFILADTENTKATCNNIGWMEEQELGPGAKVEVKKGGKIIPNIMRVIIPAKTTGAPTHCPTCDTILKVHTSDSGNKDLRCENKDCGSKHVKSWVHYLQTLGCKGLGSAALEQILQSGKVKELSGLYKLTLPDLLNNGFTERQALLALAAIHKVKPVKDDKKLHVEIIRARNEKQKIQAWQFFAALGIPGAGKTAGKALIDKFGDFNKIMKASMEELSEIDGIGGTTAQAIVDWQKLDDGKVYRLLEHIELEFPKTGKLSGQNFVLTGNFTLNKKHWHQKIEDLGGNIQSSVGSKTTYLVMENKSDDGAQSSKEKKAESLGVPVLSIPDLEKML